MKALGQMVRDWLTVKTARNPDPDLERRIEEQRLRLHEEVQLLRLSSKELVSTSKNMRDAVMGDFINDVARHRQ